MLMKKYQNIHEDIVLLENLMPEKMLIKSKKTVTRRAVLRKEKIMMI